MELPRVSHVRTPRKTRYRMLAIEERNYSTGVIPLLYRVSGAGCPLYIVPAKLLGTCGKNQCVSVRSSINSAGCRYSVGIDGWRIPGLWRDFYRSACWAMLLSRRKTYLFGLLESRSTAAAQQMASSSLLTSYPRPMSRTWHGSEHARPPPNAHGRPTAHIGPRVAFVEDRRSRELDHLIMVPGHGVTVTESLDGADSRDADWFLLDYQKEKDVPSALVGHIRGGLDELDEDEASLLLFSGELAALSFSRSACLFGLPACRPVFLLR